MVPRRAAVGRRAYSRPVTTTQATSQATDQSTSQPATAPTRAAAAALDAAFAVLAIRLLRRGDRRSALRVYLFSLAYLALLFAAMVADVRL